MAEGLIRQAKTHRQLQGDLEEVGNACGRVTCNYHLLMMSLRCEAQAPEDSGCSRSIEICMKGILA